MCRDNRRIQQTLNITSLSEHKFPMACMIYNGNKLISVGVNKYKGHPRQINPHTHTFGSIHAELDAVLKSGRTGLQGATLYVARRLKNGRFGIAKPCQSCMRIIEAAGIRRVIYTTYDGWQVLNLE